MLRNKKKQADITVQPKVKNRNLNFNKHIIKTSITQYKREKDGEKITSYFINKNNTRKFFLLHFFIFTLKFPAFSLSLSFLQQQTLIFICKEKALQNQ